MHPMLYLGVFLVIMIGIRVAAYFYMERRMNEAKPEEPMTPDKRCRATTNLGFPLPMPARCWREAGHEALGVKHYAEKGDGIIFKAEW